MVGCGFKPWRGLIRGGLTIVLTLVNLTPMQLYSSDARGSNLQQEPSLEIMMYCTGNGLHLVEIFILFSAANTVDDLSDFRSTQEKEENPHQHQRT